MIGIYAIKNIENGKMYIGQSKNLSHRKSQHLSALKAGKHHSRLLQNEYNENPQAFKFEILCKCGENDLDDLEKYYIDKYKSNDAEYGYSLNGGGITGYTVADSTRKIRSEFQKGNKNMCGIKLSDEWKRHLSEAQPHKKRVICLETSVVYESFADAARKTGLNRTKIVSCCTGKAKSTGGLHFEYYDKRTSDKNIKG